jgi:hypothetical protein
LQTSSGDQWDRALLLLNAGLEDMEADVPEGGTLLLEALRAWRQLGLTSGVALALAGLGQVAAARGASLPAGRLLGAAQTLAPAAHALQPVVVPYDLSSIVDKARAAGDRDAFDRGLAEGRGWTYERAVEAGLAEEGQLARGLSSGSRSRTEAVS